MKHDQQRPDAQEQQLLAHFREHAGGEPSAELDALILGAARAELTKAHRPGPGQRLHNWLFGAGRQRWSLALAGVACVGIGISLTWRTLERAPQAFDTVPGEVLMSPAMHSAAPSASMAEASGAPQLQARKRLVESEELQRSGPAVASDKLEMSSIPQAILAEPAAHEAPEPQVLDEVLQVELQRLRQLRREGHDGEAGRLLLELQQRYPQVNLEAALKQLPVVE